MTPWHHTDVRIVETINRDPQLRQLIPSRAVNERIRQPGLADHDIIAAVLAGYETRPALGERAYEIVRDAATGRRHRRYLQDFATITYGEVQQRVEALANAWRHHSHHALRQGDFLCILGRTGTDVTVVDLGCVYARAVAVPLQANLQLTDLAKIVEDTAPPVVVASLENLPRAVSLASENAAIRSIIVIDFDPRDDDDQDAFRAAEAGVAALDGRVLLTTLGELISFGSGFEWTPHRTDADEEERPATLIYTSGATGTPKGAIYPERVAKQYWIDSRSPVPRITVAYAPMDHMMGQHALFATLSQGGTSYFTIKSDMSTLLEDIRLVRPTTLLFIPRFAQLIYQHYRTEVIRRSRNRPGNIDAVQAEVRAEMRESYLGDRLFRGMVGGAATPPQVVEFLRDCFDFPLAEGYGSTEIGGATLNDRILDANVAAYKLRDAPELGYRRTDQPFPRGELLIKTRSQISGYFKNPEATAKLFDAEGYVATGDIVEERGPGHLIWLDRTDDVLKLSQGEFVAVGALQAMFENHSAVVKQIFLYGNPLRSHLLAVVVPDLDAARELLGHMPDETELHGVIRGALLRVAREKGLRRFEIPRLAIVEMEGFTVANGLLSSLGKCRTPNLRRKYGERLETVYARIDATQAEAIEAIEQSPSHTSVLGKIGQALTAILGLENLDLSEPHSFAELGGDSLSAVSFALLLEQLFGVSLPVSDILSPAGNAIQWARAIEGLLSGRVKRRSVADVHGQSSRTLHARDLQLSAFLDQDTLDAAPRKAPDGPARTVLLTGATGYLGRFLCLEWLERLALQGGRLVCLIRAGDASEARLRLEKAFGDADSSLAERFRAIDRSHLEVVAGDVAEFHLGLGEADYDRLSGEVDQVVHAAAMVNHVLSYEHLFDPNVVGTAELLRFALTARQKRFDFLSSTVVTQWADEAASPGEDVPLAASVTLRNTYAAGYSASKWASEALLRDAHQNFGLPVRIFRTSMVLAHQSAVGQINVADMFTRLLYSIVTTGLAPKSFYRPAPKGQTARPHYDGLPGDFVAAAVSGIGAGPDPELRTYHVSNIHHDDGVCLDRIVDWIASAGYRVERIANHSQWIGRFEAALRDLPDEQRHHSALELLAAFRKPYPALANAIGSRGFETSLRKDLKLEVPHLSEAFVHKCLDDLCSLGLIPIR